MIRYVRNTSLALTGLLCGSLSILPLLSGAGASPRPPTLDPTYGQHPAKPRGGVGNTGKQEREANWIWSDHTADNQTVVLRNAFQLSQLPHSARIYVTADDFFTLYVNGRQIDQSVPDPKDNLVWKHVHRQDVTSLLKPGPNVVAVRATNAGSAAGVIVRLEADGKPILLTDASWKVHEAASLPTNWIDIGFDDSKWKPATVIADINGGPWEGSLESWPGAAGGVPYLEHLTLPPVALLDPHDGVGKVQFDSKSPGTLLVQPAPAVPAAAPKTASSKSSTPPDLPSVVIDFGKEIAGRVMVRALGGSVAVIAGTGESRGEALKSPWGGTHRLEASTDAGPVYTPYSAFRYARLSFQSLPGAATATKTSTNPGSPIEIRVAVDHKYYPVEYKGSFACSDDLLTRIWYTGAYTAHLCMQEDIWDAPKRDRARWMGDLHVSGEVINLAFADRFLMEQTMQRLRNDAQGGRPAGESPAGHVNGIPGYSCAWVCGLADFHRHIGDYEYLNKQHELLLSMCDYFQGELDGRQIFANRRKAWPYVDWSPEFNEDTPHARAATHLFLIKALREAVFLLYEMGDEGNAKRYASWADSLTEAAQQYLADAHTYTFGDRRQDNAMAIYAGVATPEQTQAIYNRVLAPDSSAWKQIATPYYNNYVLYAMSQAGHTADVLTILRRYWGGMLAEGATSWWEAYDPAWDKSDFHSHLQADNGTGYFVSLCHGWSAGPTSWLTEHVLGVRPTTGGFKTVEIAPNLGDLTWAEGDVPTPNGNLHVRVDKRGNGLLLHVQIPRNVKATVAVPGKTIYVTLPKDVTLKSPGVK